MTILLQRVCWNTNGWRGPTGDRYGKENSYVGTNGIGHEEWNLNTTDLIGGNVYGYIYYSPPENTQMWNQAHDIYFFTISPTKERLLVGCYRDARFLSEKEKRSLKQKYQDSILLEKRIDEVVALNIPPVSTARKARSLLLNNFAINISVCPSNIDSYHPPRPIRKIDIEGREPKYLSRYTKPLFLYKPPSGKNIQALPNIVSGGTSYELLEDSYVRYTKAQRKVIERTHNQISNRFRSWLKSMGAKSVRAEKAFVDVVCLFKNNSYIFEIKSCYGQSSRHALREALGQLLEYSYYPGREITKFRGIVIDIPPSTEDIGWFSEMNNRGVQVEIFYVKGEAVYSPRITNNRLAHEAMRYKP